MLTRRGSRWSILPMVLLLTAGVCSAQQQPQPPASAPQTPAEPAVAPEALGYHSGYHPIATAAAVTAAATVTAVTIGSIAYSLPPACSAVVVNGFTYQNCSGTWYQPQYAGSQVTYVVVNPPR